VRDHLLLYVNGRRRIIPASLALLSLSDYLRRCLGLIGTKIVCREGDCGACTVLVGRPGKGQLDYRPIDSCIGLLLQFDGTHVVTIEGLSGATAPGQLDHAEGGSLHPIQQAMIDRHASQCGFCTPGFVMSAAGLLESTSRPDDEQLRIGLAGNLCRCTGYQSILEAGRQVSAQPFRTAGQLWDSSGIFEALHPSTTEDYLLRFKRDECEHLIAGPTRLSAALEFCQAHPDAILMAGGTDLGVRINQSGRCPAKILDLNRIDALDDLRFEDGSIVAGARATWSAIDRLCKLHIPQFSHILTRFGSPQIRNMGTIGGNIANGSPSADSLPLLYVAESTLQLTSIAGTREVNINDFYLGYKQFDLRPGELITQVTIPVPAQDELIGLFKVARRHDMDIASFMAAVRMRMDGNRIAVASIALGAVGPTIIRPRRTEAYLSGKPLTEQVFREAGKLAADEIAPISDVRGSVEYRTQLTRNILLKFFYSVKGR
jgi:xanthine dehydrogenase small subunit